MLKEIRSGSVLMSSVLMVSLLSLPASAQSREEAASTLKAPAPSTSARTEAAQTNRVKLEDVKSPASPIVESAASIAVSDDFFVNTDKWTATFFSIGSATTQQIDNGGTGVSAYNYIGLNKRITSETRFSVRIPFIFNTNGLNKYGDYESQKIDLSDVILAYSDYDLTYFGNFEVSGNFKVYLPTSEYTQKAKTIARIRPEAYVTLPIGRYSYVTYAFKPDYYFQSQTAYYDDTTPTRADGSFVTDPRRTNKIASLEHYVELTLDINKYFSSKTSLGFDEDYYYGSAAEGLSGGHATFGTAAVGLEIRPFRGLRFILSVQNKPSLNTSRSVEKVAYFRPRDNSIVLQTNAFLF